MEQPKIEVMTNYKKGNVILKQGRFFLQCEIGDINDLIKELEQIQNIMNGNLLDLFTDLQKK